MEISDETGQLVQARNLMEEQAKLIFQETLGLIHIALVAHYGLEESEATELEKDLYLWFTRFCSRAGSRSPRDSRPFLLVACCQFAREYQTYLVGSGARASDEQLNSLLDREPADVARDFARSLDLLSFRRPTDD